ncbi:MAG: ABC transporter permease [Actinobacteria bacterium]|nr:MAG: ABC transporter permease [Actinomycetota bacterium]
MSFRRYSLIVWKEFVQFSRDRLLFPLVFISPILQLLMLGYVVGSDVTNLPTAIVDHDRTAMSRSIEDAFSSSGYFRVVAHPADEAALGPLLDSGAAQVGIVIEPGTAVALERGEKVPLGIVVDGTDSRIASTASGYAAQIAAQLNRQRLDAKLGAMGGPGLDARVRVVFNPALKAINAMIPGLIAEILMLTMVVVMSQAVVRERARGTLEQMFVTPITRGEYLLGKITPYFLIACVQATFVGTVGVLWFKVPFAGSIATVALGLALFSGTAIGIGLLFSLISRNQHQAQQTAMFYMIPTMVLSGFIFPIESMPPAVVPLTYLIPLRYALVVLRSAMLKGSGVGDLAAPMLAMVVFSVVVFGVAVSSFRKRLSD